MQHLPDMLALFSVTVIGLNLFALINKISKDGPYCISTGNNLTRTDNIMYSNKGSVVYYK